MATAFTSAHHNFPSTTETPDFTTPEGLRTVLHDMTADNTWATSPVAAALMRYTLRKYAPVAKAWHRDAADAAYEAFIAFRTPSTVKADDPWAVVTRAVALGVAAETHAERLLTSSDKARRPSKRPAFEPIRAGHYEEFFYDVHPRAATLDGHDFRDHDEPADDPEHLGLGGVVRAACVFLITTGWPARTVEQAVEYICFRITDLGSQASALDVLSQDLSVAFRLGYAHDTWTDLLRLLLGTKQNRTNTGRVGIFARAILGDQVAELLRDTELVDAARRTAPAVRGA